jgi:hypothetical protein
MVMFDGNTINPIDADIRNYFDLTKPECMTATLIKTSFSFIDEREQEYHWRFSNGTGYGNYQELVFSIKKKGWFRISRGIEITCGIPVKGTYGGSYVFAGTLTGYLERLEYGNIFDVYDITSTFKTKDYSSNWAYETTESFVKLIAKAKAGSTAVATLSCFLDTSTTAEAKTMSLPLDSSTRRVVQSTQRCEWGPAAFCSFQGEVISDDVAIAFEPVGISVLARMIREDTRPTVS